MLLLYKTQLFHNTLECVYYAYSHSDVKDTGWYPVYENQWSILTYAQT
jgi:hypothetical protein